MYPIQGIPAYKMTINSVDSQSTVTTLKFLPVETSVKPFTGQDEDYSVRTFLSMCENVMRQSGTTDDVDKIAFVRSRLAPGSRALKMMQSVTFLPRNLGSDYELFKKKMLRVFGGSAETPLMQQLNSIVEKISEGPRTEDPWDASIPAGEQMESCMRVLQEQGWGVAPDKTTITFDSLSKFFEVFFLLFNVKGRTRHALQSLPYGPNDSFDALITAAENKMKEGKGDTPVAMAITDDVPVESYAAVVKGRPEVCSYCSKTGHTDKRCFKRKKDLQGAGAETGDSTLSAQSTHSTQERAFSTRSKQFTHTQTHATFSSDIHHIAAKQIPPPPPTALYTTGRSPNFHYHMDSSYSQPLYFCHVHGHGHHSSDRCRRIAQKRADIEARYISGSQPSGEAERPSMKNPG